MRKTTAIPGVGVATALTVVVLTALAGVLSGCAGTALSSAGGLFTMETNVVPVVGVSEEVSVATNETGAAVWSTNLVLTTNYESEVVHKPSEMANQIGRAAGGVAGFFGPFGELATVAIGGVFGVWGWLRSKRVSRTAGVLAQVIETGRRVLEQTPQGAALEREWKDWMISHQAEHGVLLEVVKLLNEKVNPGSAQTTAERLVALMKRS